MHELKMDEGFCRTELLPSLTNFTSVTTSSTGQQKCNSSSSHSVSLSPNQLSVMLQARDDCVPAAIP